MACIQERVKWVRLSPQVCMGTGKKVAFYRYQTEAYSDFEQSGAAAVGVFWACSTIFK